VRASAPSTVANLGPGFDVFGLALNLFSDVVEVEPIDCGVEVLAGGRFGHLIPLNPEGNTAGVVALKLLELAEADFGLRLRIWKGVRPGYGLGSSGCSAAASALAVNELLGLGLSKEELVPIAALGELASSGAAHADNVSASLLGGLTIVRSYEPLDVVKLEPPENLVLAVCIPLVAVPEKKTKYARALLPKDVELKQMVHNVAHASALIAGVALGDVELIGKAMNDCVVEPVRAKLIPAYEEVRRRALQAGACGVAIGGAGPTMIAVVDGWKGDASEVAEAMREAFAQFGIEAEAYVAKPDLEGAKILPPGGMTRWSRISA